jgi:hypothetical protein
MGRSRYRVLGSHPHFLTCSVVEMTRAMNQLVLTCDRRSLFTERLEEALGKVEHCSGGEVINAID